MDSLKNAKKPEPEPAESPCERPSIHTDLVSSYPCPNCGRALIAKGFMLSDLIAVLGHLVDKILQNYRCPKCGPISIRRMDPNHRRTIYKEKLIWLLFLVAALAIPIGFLFYPRPLPVPREYLEGPPPPGPIPQP